MCFKELRFCHSANYIYLFLIVISLPTQGQVQYDLIKNLCTTEDWTIINKGYESSCSYTRDCLTQAEYLYDSDNMISKTFILSPHYKISIKGTFYGYYYSSQSGGKYISINSDNSKFKTYLTTDMIISEKTCSSLISYYINYSETMIMHTSNTLTIFIFTGFLKWSIQSLSLKVFYCSLGCQFCDFSGKCQYFQRFQDLNMNPLSTISGWYKNGVTDSNQYQIISDTNNGLQIYQFESNLSFGNIYEKALSIAFRGYCRIAFKVVSRNLMDYTIQLFINKALILEETSNGNVVAYNSIAQIFQIQEFQAPFYYAQNQISIRIIVLSVHPQAESPTYDIYTLLGIRDIVINYNESECPDDNLEPFDGCHQKLYSCVEGCKECLRGICYECKDGYTYNQSAKLCIPICGDLKIQLYEECDDGNHLPYDGCYYCKFSCPLNCSICQFGICKSFLIQKENFESINNFLELGFTYHQLINDQKIKYKNSLEQFKCLENDYTLYGFQYQNCLIKRIQWCQVYQFKTCSKCVEGYELDVNKQFCKGICNNGYLQEYEECDDKNNIQLDGCYNCQNSCQKECLLCQQQQCVKCMDGWELKNGSCFQICGDSVTAYRSFEQCDDGNDAPYDGCYQCKVECSTYCKLCASIEICYYCIDNFILKNDQCYPFCGDKIVTELEECDDGNEIEFDGCHNCLYSCPLECSQCYKGKCVQNCDNGYYFLNHECISNCGDKIIASNEECDDGNDIKFDGCYKCQNSCQLECSDCQQGKCFKCLEGFNLNNFICNDVCGNEYRNFNEECDDGNNLNWDGCNSKCQIENNFFCQAQLQSLTECSSKPLLELNLSRKQFDIQYLQISFTKKLKMISQKSFIESIKCNIIRLKAQQYTIQVTSLTDLIFDNFVEGVYNIKIVYLSTVSERETLRISFDNQLLLIDQDNLFFDQTKQYSIELQPCYVLTETQIYRAQQIQNTANFIIIGTGISSVLLLLLGYFFLCLEILDALFYQSSLRYLNLDYPQNLDIYFQSSDYISLQPILEYLKINDIFSFAIGQEYLESIYQFKYYQINADLFTNIYCQLAQISIVIIFCIFLLFYEKFYFQKCFTRKQIYYLKLYQSFILKKLSFIIYEINNHILSIKKSFSSEGIKKVFLINSWDLTFKTFLFVASNNKLGPREILSYITCSVYLLYVILYLITFYKRKPKKINQIKAIQNKHQVIILIKRILLLFILIYLQAIPTIQTLLYACISGAYLGFIMFTKLTQNSIETKMILIAESPILLFTITALAYCPDFKHYIREENRITLGFFQIGILLFSLMNPLIKPFYAILSQVRQWIAKTNSKNRLKIYMKEQIFGISVQSLIQSKK